MKERKFGRIICLTGTEEPISFNAPIPPNDARTVWSKALSLIAAKDGVTVNCIAPGIVHSEQVDERVFPTEAEQLAWGDSHIPVGYIGEGDGSIPELAAGSLYHRRSHLRR